jgi:hypothetical protein
MGVSSHGKMPANQRKMLRNICTTAAAGTPGGRLKGYLIRRSAKCNQALALLSTARSERSA